MYNKMKNANLLSKNLTFIIPVYENMPQTVSPSPDTSGEVFPKNIRVKEGHFGIMVRAGRSTDSSIIGRISGSSEIILSVERFKDGWHKVVLENETVGYLKFNTDYLEEVSDVTNCYEQKVLNSNYTLRVGPGFEHTEITSMKTGDVVYRIDNTGRYTFGGITWDRVILPDGRQGFLPRSILEDNKSDVEQNSTIVENIVDETENVVEIENMTIENNIEQNEIQNNIEQQNNVEENEIDENLVEERNTLVDEQANMTGDNNTQENVAGNNNTQVNIVGENSSQSNITDENNTGNTTIEDNNSNETNNEIIEDDTTQSERKYLVIAPDKQAKDLDGIVTKDGVETEEAGTGYKINIDGKEYIIVKRGDANGDGYVKANDYLIIKDYIIGTNKNLVDEYLQASDVTNDKSVKANDYLKIKDSIMYGVEI